VAGLVAAAVAVPAVVAEAVAAADAVAVPAADAAAARVVAAAAGPVAAAKAKTAFSLTFPPAARSGETVRNERLEHYWHASD
jgi:hypothetical protein